MNPMDLKCGIDKAVEAIVQELKANARNVTNNDEIAQVGTISINGDTEIGRALDRLDHPVDSYPDERRLSGKRAGGSSGLPRSSLAEAHAGMDAFTSLADFWHPGAIFWQLGASTGSRFDVNRRPTKKEI
jgi:hypothetical protein